MCVTDGRPQLGEQQVVVDGPRGRVAAGVLGRDLVGEQTRGGANPGRLLSIDERFEMVATRPGFGTAQSTMELPMDPSKRRVLVEIQRGGSGVNPSTTPGGNLYDEAAKYDPTIRSKGSGGN